MFKMVVAEAVMDERRVWRGRGRRRRSRRRRRFFIVNALADLVQHQRDRRLLRRIRGRYNSRQFSSHFVRCCICVYRCINAVRCLGLGFPYHNSQGDEMDFRTKMNSRFFFHAKHIRDVLTLSELN